MKQRIHCFFDTSKDSVKLIFLKFLIYLMNQNIHSYLDGFEKKLNGVSTIFFLWTWWNNAIIIFILTLSKDNNNYCSTIYLVPHESTNSLLLGQFWKKISILDGYSTNFFFNVPDESTHSIVFGHFQTITITFATNFVSR